MDLSNKNEVNEILNKLLFTWRLCDDRLKALVDQSYPNHVIKAALDETKEFSKEELLKMLKSVINTIQKEERCLLYKDIEIVKIMRFLEQNMNVRFKICVPKFNYIENQISLYTHNLN